MADKPLSRSKSKPVKVEGVEIDPDAWPKFEKLIRDAAKRGPKPGPRLMRHLAEAAPQSNVGELAKARARIAELERKIGQQAIDIDFFQRALRVLKTPDVQGRPMREGKPATKSRKSSKP